MSRLYPGAGRQRATRALLWGITLGVLLANAAAGVPLVCEPLAHPAEVHGQVVVWGWNIASASLSKLVPSFNAIYPGVCVDVSMTGTNLQSRFLLSLSAGVGAPDVSQLECCEAPRYSPTGRLTDLTEVARRYDGAFAPAFWHNCLYEGRIYAIPWDMGPCAVFYKRSLFQRYQIDPDAIETWDDYIEAGRRLVQRSAGSTRMLFLAPGQLDSLFEILLQQCDGQFFDEQGRVVIDSPQAQRVLAVLKKLYESGIASRDNAWGHAFYASLKGDMVASYPMAAWFGGLIRDHAPETSGDWGVFRLPALEPGGLRTSNIGGSVLVIPDQCANKEAAWAYVQHVLCTPEAQLAQYRDFELFPALLSTHGDPFFDEPVPFFGGQRVRRLFATDIERIPPLHRTSDWRETMRYLNQALSKWATNGMEAPGSFLHEFQQRLSRRLVRESGAPAASGETG